MSNLFRCLLIVGFGTYSVVQLVWVWQSDGSLRGQIEITASYGGLMTVLVVWMNADRRGCIPPPKDGREADYVDPPAG